MIVCPKCSKENQDHYKFCLGCGSELPKDVGAPGRAFSTPTPPAGIPVAPPPEVHAGLGSPGFVESAPAFQPPAAAPSAPRPVATSPRAAPAPAPARVVEFEDEQTLAPPPQPPKGMRKCPSCQTENPAAFKFCGACGARLDTAAPPAAEAPQQVEEPSAAGHLVLIRPDGSEGGSFPLNEGENPVGRDIHEVFRADAYLSPRHAVFTLADGRMTVSDDGSLNGIFVRIPADKAIEVSSGDVVRLGQELIKIEVIPEAEAQEDGTELMGSAIDDLWGRISLIVGKEQMANAFGLTGEGAVLGRERGDVLFPEDGYVSGRHLMIARQGDKITVTDLNSSNGTFLRVASEADLQRGDYILMGQQLFRVDY